MERSKFLGATRRTHVINNATGEMRELEDDWTHVGPLALNEERAGRTELAVVGDDEDMAVTTPAARTLPPASAAVKRESEKMSGDMDEEDKQAEKAPALDHDEEELG